MASFAPLLPLLPGLVMDVTKTVDTDSKDQLVPLALENPFQPIITILITITVPGWPAAPDLRLDLDLQS